MANGAVKMVDTFLIGVCSTTLCLGNKGSFHSLIETGLILLVCGSLICTVVDVVLSSVGSALVVDVGGVIEIDVVPAAKMA